MSLPSITQRLATELNIRPQQVDATVALLDEGATVPFIARYRKEVTGALDDSQLRTLEERLGYLRDMEDRRASVLNSIEEQGKLTDSLSRDIKAAATKTGADLIKTGADLVNMALHSTGRPSQADFDGLRAKLDPLL